MKFVKGKDEESVLASPGDGISAIAAHSVNKVIAIADRSIPPKIYVLSYPAFERKAILEGIEFIRYALYEFRLYGTATVEYSIW